MNKDKKIAITIRVTPQDQENMRKVIGIDPEVPMAKAEFVVHALRLFLDRKLKTLPE